VIFQIGISIDSKNKNQDQCNYITEDIPYRKMTQWRNHHPSFHDLLFICTNILEFKTKNTNGNNIIIIIIINPS
jgi:hypothetical protein